jgi:transposase
VLTLTPTDRRTLEAAAAGAGRVRRWRRYQAILLLADGHPPEAVAQALGCGVSTVYRWAARWRNAGMDGLTEGDHGGGRWALDATGEEALVGLLTLDPQTRGHQATSWTVPLLHGELRRIGYDLSARTVRRALHRLGYRWKRPRFVLGRPDPEYAAKKRR